MKPSILLPLIYSLRRGLPSGRKFSIDPAIINPPQTEQQKQYYLERARLKRERKNAKRLEDK